MANNKTSTKIYWNDYVPDTQLEKFQKLIEKKYNVKFNSYRELHRWTVENYTDFWGELWHFSGVIASTPYKQVLVKTGTGFLDIDWFRGAKLNYAENILRIRDDRGALMYFDELGNEETVTFAEMYEEVRLYAAAFRKNGLKIGDSVACFMSNRKEAIFTLLAVASIGAMFGGPAPFYGSRVVSNVIRMMDAKFLIAIDSHQDNGVIFRTLDYLPEITDNAPTIQKVILVATERETREKDLSNIRNCVFLEDFLLEGRTEDGNIPDILFEQLPFNHPLHIDFTSGSTGLPKAVVHSAGTFLSIMRDHAFFYDLKNDDVICCNFPVGWNIWEQLIPCLALGSKIFLNCSSVYYTHHGKNFWDLMDKYKVKLTFLVTSMVDKMEKLGIIPGSTTNLEYLKLVIMGGSPVKLDNFEFIRNKVKKDLLPGVVYGATEFFGFFGSCCFNVPVNPPEIQVPSLGVDIQCFDSEGKSVFDQRGELVICTPAVNFPLHFWKDENNKMLTKSYFSKYSGVWSQHDECRINSKTYGFIVTGRSDDTIIQNGERFGSNDIYLAIHSMEEIRDYICVGQTKSDGDSRAILFVKMQEGHRMSPEVKDKIARKIEEELWEDIVPELILDVLDIPYNMNNKRMESAVRDIVEMNKIPEIRNIKNPESLKYFLNIPEVVNYKKL